MKNNHKALLVSLCALLLVVTSVFGTFAYFVDTEFATNTFTVGKVDIELDETDTDSVPGGNRYHLLPGHSYTKDPTVTVVEKSENAYVRMIVTVTKVAELKAALGDAYKPTDLNEDGEADVALEMLLKDKDGNTTWNYNYWHFVEYKENGSDATYEFRYYNYITKVDYVVKSDSATKLPALFTTIKVPGELDNADIAHLANVTIVVEAHAIQAAGFANADEAWSNFTK